MIRTGEAANKADVSRKEGLTRARVSQLLGLLRLHPAILDDLEAEDGTGPVPTEGALRKLSMLPRGEQPARYQTLLEAELSTRPARSAGAARAHAHLPRRGFAHLLDQARRYQALLDSGEVRTLEEIGQREGITGDRAGQILGLLQLAPDILEAVEQPGNDEPEITYKDLLRIARMPGHIAQRRAFYGRPLAATG